MRPHEHYLKAEEILDEVYHLRLNPEAVAQAHVHALLAQIVPVPEEKHDEETMDKVRNILVDVFSEVTVQSVTVTVNDTISALQNAGILFRERN